MKNKTVSQNANARRQAAYANRQRALGRKKFSYWMSENEAAQVSLLLEQLRARQKNEGEA